MLDIYNHLLSKSYENIYLCFCQFYSHNTTLTPGVYDVVLSVLFKYIYFKNILKMHLPKYHLNLNKMHTELSIGICPNQ